MPARVEAPTHQFNPAALILAWVWPGLGHIVIGERARGVRIMAGVLFLVIGGTLIGGIDVVDRREDGPWFLAQAGCGPLAFGVDQLNTLLLKSGEVGKLLAAPPSGTSSSLVVSDRKGLAHVNEFGTLFVALAGLMNIVAVLDAGFRGRGD